MTENTSSPRIQNSWSIVFWESTRFFSQHVHSHLTLAVAALCAYRMQIRIPRQSPLLVKKTKMVSCWTVGPLLCMELWLTPTYWLQKDIGVICILMCKCLKVFWDLTVQSIPDVPPLIRLTTVCAHWHMAAKAQVSFYHITNDFILFPFTSSGTPVLCTLAWFTGTFNPLG